MSRRSLSLRLVKKKLKIHIYNTTVQTRYYRSPLERRCLLREVCSRRPPHRGSISQQQHWQPEHSAPRFPFEIFSDGFFDLFGLMLEDEAMGVVGSAIDEGGKSFPLARECRKKPRASSASGPDLLSLCNKCLFHLPLHFLNQTYSHHRGRGR
jgi:hypothetical protein